MSKSAAPAPTSPRDAPALDRHAHGVIVYFWMDDRPDETGARCAFSAAGGIVCKHPTDTHLSRLEYPADITAVELFASLLERLPPFRLPPARGKRPRSPGSVCFAGRFRLTQPRPSPAHQVGVPGRTCKLAAPYLFRTRTASQTTGLSGAPS